MLMRSMLLAEWTVLLLSALVSSSPSPRSPLPSNAPAAGTGTSNTAPDAFRIPASANVDSVNPMLGNGGDTPNGSGGMIPSCSPPFAQTRWTPAGRQNFVSGLPYNVTDTTIAGFQGTHQPAIWMGESGQVVVAPGVGKVKTAFKDRGLSFSHDDEISTVSYYSVKMNAGEGGEVIAEMSSTSRVGHLRFTFDPISSNSSVASPNASEPHVIVQATRGNITGWVQIDPSSKEIRGWNPERQDHVLGPFNATHFKGYFVARFDTEFASWGTGVYGNVTEGEKERTGQELSAFVRFNKTSVAEAKTTVNVRVGHSFVSIEQARSNIDSEIPDGTTLEKTAEGTRKAWADKLDVIELEGATNENRTTFYTGVVHALTYPYDMFDYEGGDKNKPIHYSGYDDKIHQGKVYNGWSNWDTFRAEWNWLILLAPERIADMMQSILIDFEQEGWTPMWKNIVETNIMVAEHADSILATAFVLQGGKGFDRELAWKAVYTDSMVPPINDTTIQYADRQQGTPVEANAGLTLYKEKGFVAADQHTESASRTLDYAYDDYAVSVIADALGKTKEAEFFRQRSKNYQKIWNNDTGFMEARLANGSFAGPDVGWTEGDKWQYTFDVMHDIPGLVDLMGYDRFVETLNNLFLLGHDDHTNEPSHHIPYLFAMVGKAAQTQERVRSIGQSNYNSTDRGLSGNEDCGQMSAWYLFSSLGMYPVNPASDEYVVGAPYWDKATIRWPGAKEPLVIEAAGAGATSKGLVYVKSLTVNGEAVDKPVLKHSQIANGGHIVFEMTDKPTSWGSKGVLP